MTPRRIKNLREKIRARTRELGVVFESREDGHWYGFGSPDWKSITRKLGIIKDGALMNWKMNRALESVEAQIRFLKAKNPLLNSSIFEEMWEDIREKAKLAPQQEFEGAGDIGSAVHAWRERWFNNWIKNNEDVPYYVVDVLPHERWGRRAHDLRGRETICASRTPHRPILSQHLTRHCHRIRACVLERARANHLRVDRHDVLTRASDVRGIENVNRCARR